MPNYGDIKYPAAAAATTIVSDMAGLVALSGMSSGDQALVTSLNKLFMYTGSGWFLIATMTNASPTSITGVNGTYALTTDGTATTITAVSTDPEGFPLTWSYSTSGLSSIATVSNVDNVFTITPSTDSSNAGTFILTISVTDGATGAVNAVSSLSLSFVVTNSRYTSLLLSANAAGTNSTFTDSSSNNNSISTTYYPSQGSFTPYRKGGYSLSSEKGSAGVIGTAADDYAIKIADSADLDVASGEDFTYEFWFKADPQPAGDVWPATSIILTSLRNVFYGGNGWYPQVRLNRYTSGAYAGKDTMSVYINSQFKDLYTEIDRSVWNHICIIRSSNVWKFYINGTEDTYQPGWVSSLYWPFTESAPVIAQGAWAGNDGVYIKDFRYVVGTAIVPPVAGPSQPLSVVSGTKFLLCSLPYLADANNTAGGGLAPKTVIQGDYINKIIPSSPYDYGSVDTTDGGSMEFDGHSAVVNPASGSITAPAGDFNIQFWAYPREQVVTYGHNSTSLSRSVFDTRWVVGGIHIEYHSSQTYYVYLGSSSVTLNGVAGDSPKDSWHHVCFTRNGSTFKLYLNGKEVDTNSTSVTFSQTAFDSCQIGRNHQSSGGGPAAFNGAISDLKFDSSTAITAEFIPPTSSLSSSGADIHLKGLGAKVFDKTQTSNIKNAFKSGQTVGEVAGSNTQAKHAGTYSVYFDGVNDFTNFQVPTIRTGSFTIEFWFYNVSSSDWGGIFQIADNHYPLRFNAGSEKGPALGIHSGGNYRRFNGTSGTNIPFAATSGSWVHVVVQRDASLSSNNTTYYFDGVLKDTTTDNTDYDGNQLTIGTYYDNTLKLQMYLQDFRISLHAKYANAAAIATSIATGELSAPLKG